MSMKIKFENGKTISGLILRGNEVELEEFKMIGDIKGKRIVNGDLKINTNIKLNDNREFNGRILLPSFEIQIFNEEIYLLKAYYRLIKNLCISKETSMKRSLRNYKNNKEKYEIFKDECKRIGERINKLRD